MYINPIVLTEAEYLYHERLAICLAEGVPVERAEEIAREQVEGEQAGLFGGSK